MNSDSVVLPVRFSALAAVPANAPIQLDELARMLRRHPASIKRAVKRGELPEGVVFMGKKTWTAGQILASECAAAQGNEGCRCISCAN